jgi:hypothetical protein
VNIECCDGNGNCVDQDLDDIVSSTRPQQTGGSSGGGGPPDEEFRDIVSFAVTPVIQTVRIAAGSTILREFVVENQDIVDGDFTSSILRSESTPETFDWMVFDQNRKAVAFTIEREGGLATNNEFVPYTISVPEDTPVGTYTGVIEVNGLEQTEQLVVEIQVIPPVFTNLFSFFERELFEIPFTAQEIPTGEVVADVESTGQGEGKPFKVWHLITTLGVLGIGTFGYFRLRKRVR